MRILSCLLVLLPLAAQDATGLPGDHQAFRSRFETDPLTQVRLVPPGSWEGLLLNTSLRPLPPPQRRGQATVEVWDLAYHETPRQEAFFLYRKDLRKSLTRALAQLPSSHAAIDLGELMLSDPGHPERLDLTRVQSLQDRFNRPPGSTRR